jgi:serine/threonine-protein kinase
LPRLQRLGLSSIDADPVSLLQSRLRMFHLIIFGLAGSLLLASLIVNALRGRAPTGSLANAYLLHGGIVAVVGVSWFVLGARRLSSFALQVLDAASLCVIGLLVAGILVLNDVRYRPELSMLLGLAHVLVGRAALVPSTALRTTMIGLVTLQPIILATYFALSRHAIPDWLGPPRASVSMAIVWALLIVGLSVVTSRVIYGLRRKVQQALQLGQYTVERFIGKGGMGTVYLARHSLLRRPTALKVLEADAAGDEAIARFEREVQITSQLTHPNTVAIYDYGRTPDASFYYAMEYLDGVDLDTLVAADGPQPPARVIHILRQVCGALAEAHSLGLVHRDIKPANIMLGERGLLPDFVKVLDFGLVRTQAMSEPALTGEQAVRGTPLYMAPEMILGSSEMDARADIYGVGAVAYFLLAGRPAFEGRTSMEIMARQLRDAPAPPSSKSGHALPARLEALVLACLEKDPARRPASMTALRAAIDELGIEEWTEADARRWWRERSHQARDARALRQEKPGLLSIPVDLARRPAVAELHQIAHSDVR